MRRVTKALHPMIILSVTSMGLVVQLAMSRDINKISMELDLDK